MPKHPKSHKKEKYLKKLRIVSTCEATGISSTFASPANTTENSYQSSPRTITLKKIWHEYKLEEKNTLLPLILRLQTLIIQNTQVSCMRRIALHETLH